MSLKLATGGVVVVQEVSAELAGEVRVAMNTDVEVTLWPRRSVTRGERAEPRRSRTRETSPRLRRPPKWSARALPRRVA
ncbi:MAG: hypothetical protein JNK82_12800 [Myxococcaceae bacterium]|nr:hypothetical protein [Myxococcaceae bacterium]